ncbi:MAG: SgcJ/EcaC family oxidoreductase [Gammaproteobacteria bacterium]|jgi:uncharacterized protein (TIGR02246 family)|nr:SgcJ/EcaC family oxidoreductase [Gammaproteobacteria bacterium]
MLPSTDNLLQRLVTTTLLSMVVCLAPRLGIAAQAAKPETSASTCTFATESNVVDLFSAWNLALASLDPARVTSMYWPDAVLLPTVSNVPRTNSAAIQDYFEHFLQRFPRGEITERVVHIGCNVAMDMGLYVFSVMDANGRASSVSARYTFVYTLKNGIWKIQHHHSSAMPEPAATAQDTHGKTAKPTSDDEPSKPRQESSALSSTDASSRPAPPSSPKAPATIRLASASRTANSWLSPEQRRKVGRDSVGLKICAAERSTARTVEISAPSPFAEANEAAVSWARAARWSVSGEPTPQEPVCAQVVVRFTDAGL